jgi:hypothetical protein
VPLALSLKKDNNDKKLFKNSLAVFAEEQNIQLYKHHWFGYRHLMLLVYFIIRAGSV